MTSDAKLARFARHARGAAVHPAGMTERKRLL
jgi:hypothetical protein